MSRQVIVSSAVLFFALTVPAYSDQCDDQGLEGVLRCSDLIVLGHITETLPEGIRAGDGGIIHTVNILEVEEYFLGSGPKEIQLLTQGGVWTDSDGRKRYLSIAGGSDWRGARVGEKMVAFLQKSGTGYVFVNRCGSKLAVQKDPDSGLRQVVIRFQKKEYLKGAGLQEYEKAEMRMHSSNAEEAADGRRRLYGAFYETIPLGELSSRLRSALSGEGGPKSPTTICY